MQQLDREIVDRLASCWADTAQLAALLSMHEWDAPTECPGWSVKDNISHLIAIERRLLGLPADPPLEHYPAHVKNDIGQFNEAAIERRRSLDGELVLAEFVEVTQARLVQLAAFSDDDFAKLDWSPIGNVPYRDFMMVRLFDSWAHEQDIRRATGRTTVLVGPNVDAVIAWHRRSLGYIVGKRAHAPEGSCVAFSVTGPTVEHAVVAVHGGRAALVSDPTVAPDCILESDTDTYHALLCGRITAAQAIETHRLVLRGDMGLGRTVADAMGYVF